MGSALCSKPLTLKTCLGCCENLFRICNDIAGMMANQTFMYVCLYIYICECKRIIQSEYNKCGEQMLSINK